MKRKEQRRSTLSLVTGAWLGTVMALHGAVTITGVEVNDKPLSPVAPTADNYPTLRFSSDARFLRFHFTQTNGERRLKARLRYKLEGYDTSWRDLANTMHGFVQFRDRDYNGAGIQAFYMEGETPGWNGSLETADYLPQRKEWVVPERAAMIDVVLLSQGPESTVGQAGFDDIHVRVAPPSDARPKEFDLSISAGTNLSQPTGQPAQWERQGSLIAMAELRTRTTPMPHPILTFNDTDPIQFAIWATRRENPIPVAPGDTLTLEWKTAYSIGGCGPGVAEYRNLKPGNYFLRVAACRANGDPTGEEAVLPLTIVPPFYHRWEFWLAMLILSSIGSTFIVRLTLQRRMRRRLAELERERALDRERERIARDLHDNIGAGLTEIAMQTDWIDGDLDHGPTEQTRQRVKSIRQSATDLARGVDEMVWAVNPANDNLKRFVTYLTQCAAQFLEAAALAVRFDIPEELPALPLTGKIRHNLFLVVREALNNTAKHAHAGIVRLEIRVEDHALHLAIEDDGQGFDPAQADGEGIHDGLDNMRRRMEDIGGRFQLASHAGKGTRIELWAPLART
jgi:signal transduction histidine kinase